SVPNLRVERIGRHRAPLGGDRRRTAGGVAARLPGVLVLVAPAEGLVWLPAGMRYARHAPAKRRQGSDSCATDRRFALPSLTACRSFSMVSVSSSATRQDCSWWGGSLPAARPRTASSGCARTSRWSIFASSPATESG